MSVGQIAEGRVDDFFVGRGGALVHDNTQPGRRLAPFDVPPSLASASASGSTAATDRGR